VDFDGNNLIHETARNYEGTAVEVQFIEKLMGYGISVNATNNRGLHALHFNTEHGGVFPPISRRDVTPLLSVLQRCVVPFLFQSLLSFMLA